MNRRQWVMACFLLSFVVSIAAAQGGAQQDANDTQAAAAIHLTDPGKLRYRVGMRISAAGPVRNLRAGCVVPMAWPEQRVELIDEQNSLRVEVGYQVLDGTVRQMVIASPGLRAGQTLEVLQTYEITRYRQEAPEDPEQLRAPKSVPRALRPYVRPGIGIECNHRDLRTLHRELAIEGAMPWQQVHAYYDWTRSNLRYALGPLKGAVATLKDGEGDCEDLTAVFIALCRREGIPARTVWVPGHVWAEFYLVDADGHGRWYPAELTGPRQFGRMAAYTPILQKGERFRPAGTRTAVRYVAPWAVGDGTAPRLEFISEVLTPPE